MANGDDDVLIKIAADISTAAEAMGQMVELMSQMVEAINATGAASAEAAGQTDTLTESVTSGATAADALAVAMGQQLSEAIDAAQEGLKGIVTSLPSMVTGAAAAGDEMYTMSQRLNVSVESLAEMDYIAQQTGASMQGMARTVQTMGTVLADSGSKGAKGIASIGLSVEELKRQKPDEAFFKIIEALKTSIPDATQRSAKAMEIFGNRFRNNTMLLNEDITGLREKFKELGGGMTTDLAEAGDAYEDALNNIKVAQEGFRNQIASAVLPAINSLLEAFPSLGGALLTVGQGLFDAAQAFIPLLGSMAMMAGPKGLPGVMDGFQKLGPMIKLHIIQLYEMAAAALTNPWTWIAVAAVALGAAVYKLIGGMDGLNAIMATVSQVVTDLWTLFKKWFADLAAGDGTMKAFGTMVGWLVDMFKSLWEWLNKIAGSFGRFFKGLADALHEQAESARKSGEAVTENAEAQAAAAREAENLAQAQKYAITGFDALRVAANETTDAYNTLVLTNKDLVKEALEGGATTAQVVDSLVKELAKSYLTLDNIGLTLASVTAAVEKFKGTMKASAGEKSPLQKLAEDAKKLGEELGRAGASTPTEQMEEFGKKASDALKQAERLEGGLAKLPENVKKLGEAWDAAQLDIKAKKFAEQVEGIDKAFATMVRTIANDGVKALQASEDILRKMKDDAVAATLEGGALRLHQIQVEEREAILSIQRQKAADQEATMAKIEAARALGADAIKTLTENGKAMTAEKAAQVESDVALAIRAATETSAATQAGFDAQIAAHRAAAAERVRIEQGLTTELMELQEELALETMTDAERRIYFINQEEKAREAAIRKRHGLDTAAAEKEIAILREIYKKRRKEDEGYTGDLEIEMERRGLKTKQAQEKAIKAEKDLLDQMIAARKAGDDSITEQAIANQRKRLTGMEHEAAQVERIWLDVVDEIADRMGQLGDVVGGGVGKTLTQLGGTIKGIKSNMKFGTEQMDILKGSGTGMQKAGAVANMGMGLAEGAMELKGALDQRKKSQRVMGGAMAGAKMGAMFGPIGMGVGAGVGALIGALHEPKWVKAANEVGKKWGVEISDGLAKQIQDDAKTKFKGDRGVAAVFNMDAIIGEAGGVTSKNVDKLTTQLTSVFDLVKQGKLTADEGREILDKNFGAFAEHIVSSGKIATKAFTDIIAKNAEMKEGSKEIVAFVGGQAGRAATGIAKIIDGFGDLKPLDEVQKRMKEIDNQQKEMMAAGEQQSPLFEKLSKEWDTLKLQARDVGESVARMERLTVAGFNAAIKAGVPFLDAIEEMGPALDKVSEANKALGREGGAAIQELLQFREVASANKDLVESAGALNEVMLALSNVGALNEETFADMQAQGLETYTQLTAAGFTEQQSLQQMKGFLESVRDAHKEIGLPIDENTQLLIDQAEQSGVLSKQQMSTNDIMLQGLGAIIEALGGKLPDAFKTMAESADKAATTVSDSMNVKVGGALDKNTAKMNATPFASFAAKGIVASDITQKAIGGVEGAVGSVADGLESTDWAAWAQAAVDAAATAAAAVNTVSFGESPGGIKEIPLKLAEAITAFQEWEKESVSSAGAVKESVDAVTGPPSPAVQQQQQVTTAMAAPREGGESVTVNISAFDTQGMEQAVESRVIPAIVKALRKGGRGLHDIQGVLR